MDEDTKSSVDTLISLVNRAESAAKVGAYAVAKQALEELRERAALLSERIVVDTDQNEVGDKAAKSHSST